MKELARFVIIFVVCVILVSCSKNTTTTSAAVAVNVANANVGSQGIIANFWGNSFSYQNYGLNIGYGSASNFGISAGDIQLTIVQASDTAQPFINASINLKAGGIYSLFIAGSASSPDTLFIEDAIPHLPVADSLTGVRFVNLVQGGSLISIDIQGNTGNAVNNLGYKNITGFQQISANSAAQMAGYIFEFRDEVSDSLLVSYPLNMVQNHCQTLIFGGSATVGYTVFAENNF